MATRLTAIPDRITAGTSVELTLSYSEHPADDGWGLKLFIHGKNDVTIDGADVVANGKAFDVTITAAKTATLGTGAPREGLIHDWDVRLTKSADIKDVESGTVTIDPDPATATASALQSFAEKMVALIRSALSGQTSTDVFIQAYQIADRGLTRIDREVLTRELAYWESKATAEKFPGRWGPQVLAHMSPPS